jgi:hypothetical protein
VSDYLSNALHKIWSGKKADDAFGIKRRRGEKDNRQAQQRSFRMADCVGRLHRDGTTLEKAFATVAARFNRSEESVKRAWKQNYKEVRRQISLEEEHLGKVMPISLP